MLENDATGGGCAGGGGGGEVEQPAEQRTYLTIRRCGEFVGV